MAIDNPVELAVEVLAWRQYKYAGEDRHLLYDIENYEISLISSMLSYRENEVKFAGMQYEHAGKQGGRGVVCQSANDENVAVVSIWYSWAVELDESHGDWEVHSPLFLF
ncbi:hypothetical protein Ancab_016497 [Ancistrocladus abbreviatus]